MDHCGIRRDSQIGAPERLTTRQNLTSIKVNMVTKSYCVSSCCRGAAVRRSPARARGDWYLALQSSQTTSQGSTNQGSGIHSKVTIHSPHLSCPLQTAIATLAYTFHSSPSATVRQTVENYFKIQLAHKLVCPCTGRWYGELSLSVCGALLILEPGASGVDVIVLATQGTRLQRETMFGVQLRYTVAIL